ncbi:hypothetical protein GQ54DRAFT_297665 [Martensiomyces pterosporus]|nr:hypothetical protein GQ54DRAFT_297665 [Martensiomyces pterosporus]
MNVGTRARAKAAESASGQSRHETTTPQESRSKTSAKAPAADEPEEVAAGGTLRDTSSGSADSNSNSNNHATNPATHTENTPEAHSNSENAGVSIPAQSIHQFKEAVVNTSRLLRVFNEQEKELAKAKAEIGRYHDESKRVHTAYQNLQREMESKVRNLAKANAETENARSLLVLRERELSRVHGLKEDLEAKVAELSQVEPAADQGVPPKSPNVALMEEIERLKKELEAKEGSLKSLRISRDSIRSSTKAEVMSIQAKYAREQMELIDKQEKQMTQHRLSLANKEAELEQEQERLMQLEMDLSMRTTQLEDSAAELKANLESVTSKYEASQLEIKKLEEQAKTRSSEHKAEVAKLNRGMKKDEKKVADLEAALAKAKDAAKEAAKENAKARAKHRPKSTSTAAEAISAATQDVVDMDMDELRDEVARLRVDAVHKDETIRRLSVMVEEVKREQNPEGRKPRTKLSALQAEVDELKEELAVRDKKVEALETALHISEAAADNGGAAAVDTAAAIAQLDLKVISLETALKDKDQKIADLDRELREAREAANERPMRLRHSSLGRSPGAQSVGPGLAQTPVQSTTHPRGLAQSLRDTQSARGGHQQEPQRDALYAEVAGLRAKASKLEHEKAALLELVTEQQVKIRHLREGSTLAGGSAASMSEGTGRPIPPSHQPVALSTPTPAHRKRTQHTTEEIEQSGTIVSKRPKVTAASSSDANANGSIYTPMGGLSQSSKRPSSSSAAAAKQRSDGTSELDIETIERLLKDRRISSINRAKRFFSMMQKSPSKLYSALLQMHEEVPNVDSSEFLKLLVALVASLSSAKPASDIKMMPMQGAGGLGSGEKGREFVVDERVAGRVPAGLYESEANLAMAVWILSYKNGHGEFFGSLMRQMAQKVIAPNERSVVATCSLARIFAALCFMAVDIQRLRVLLCDLLMEAVDSPHTLPVISNVLSVWPAVLAEPGSVSVGAPPSATPTSAFNLVFRVFQAIAAGIHDLYSEEHGKEEADALYAVMVDQCSWRPPSEAEFADRILVEVKQTLESISQESTEYPVVMCAYNLLAPYVIS